MRDGPARAKGRGGSARLLALCAVLCGLFLMHGSPATAAEGCHGGTAAMAMSAMPATGAMRSPPSTATAHATTAHAAMVDDADASARRRAALPVTEGAHGHGELCVSTRAHDRVPLPDPRPLPVSSGGPSAVRGCVPPREAMGRAGWRGPPSGGRDLLLQVCVART
ncbi:hypothetical protein [Streptomyces sp. NPDC005573]|uniref:hypothetical protein n=1 Tax=Streptomyces sp. NPDC005573 TaxID=3156890 RepID=UPI0033BE3E77